MANFRGTVVFVPGIAGSDLRGDTVPAAKRYAGRTVWLDSVALLSGGYGALETADANGMAVNSFAHLFGSVPLADFYGPFIEWIRGKEYEVVAPAIDWRLAVSRTGQAIVDKVIELEQQAKTPCQIIAHSRGGLATRWALKLLKDAGKIALVKRVFGLCVPNLGSWGAVKLLCGWDESAKRLIGYLGGIFGPPAPAEGFAAAVQRIISTWPSAYELLPKPGSANGRPSDLSNVWAPSYWQSLGISFNADYHAAASAWWGTLPAQPPLEVEWINVYGTGKFTPWLMKPGVKFVGSGTLDGTEDGDGTVLDVSGRAILGTFLRLPCSHSGVVRDYRLYSRLPDMLKNGLPTSVVETGQFVD